MTPETESTKFYRNQLKVIDMRKKTSQLSLTEIGKLYADLAALPDDVQFDPGRASEALEVMGIRIARQTLAKIRSESSEGPAFRKTTNGRVVYRLGDLRRFAGLDSTDSLAVR
jgi:hypothetical protein